MAALSLVLSSNAAFARQAVLKCHSDKGESLADITIDLEQKVMRLGDEQVFSTTIVTDQYITAIGSNETVPPAGGEVWVIDRSSGVFKRVGIGMFYTDRHNGAPPEGPNLQTYLMSGRCNRPLL